MQYRRIQVMQIYKYLMIGELLAITLWSQNEVVELTKEKAKSQVNQLLLIFVNVNSSAFIGKRQEREFSMESGEFWRTMQVLKYVSFQEKI